MKARLVGGADCAVGSGLVVAIWAPFCLLKALLIVPQLLLLSSCLGRGDRVHGSIERRDSEQLLVGCGQSIEQTGQDADAALTGREPEDAWEDAALPLLVTAPVVADVKLKLTHEGPAALSATIDLYEVAVLE